MVRDGVRGAAPDPVIFRAGPFHDGEAMRFITASFCAMALFTTPALAQHQHGQQGMPAGQQHGAMGGDMMMGGLGGTMMGPLSAQLGAFAPAALLDRQKDLELTPAQVTRLEAIRDHAAQESEQVHAPAHAAMQSLRTEMASPSPDLEKVKALFQAHHTAMGNTQWVAVQAAVDARAVLTPEQVTKASAAK